MPYLEVLLYMNACVFNINERKPQQSARLRKPFKSRCVIENQNNIGTSDFKSKQLGPIVDCLSQTLQPLFISVFLEMESEVLCDFLRY